MTGGQIISLAKGSGANGIADLVCRRRHFLLRGAGGRINGTEQGAGPLGVAGLRCPYAGDQQCRMGSQWIGHAIQIIIRPCSPGDAHEIWVFRLGGAFVAWAA